MNSEKRIFADDLSSKNRRDGATVATRVLQLAGKLGQDLYNSASTTSGVEWRDNDATSGKTRGKAMRATARL